MKIAIILFPGTNCEHETKRAVESVGMDAEIIRWNEPLQDYDGYILPGGWSYEDRIRAGAIAAKDSIVKKIRQEAAKGKPVLGICNGCQVLIEAGLVPAVETETMQMAVAPNTNPFVEGYYCTWAHLQVENECAFTKGSKENVFQIPIAHGEGRFVTRDKTLLKKLIQNKQVILRYCDAEGRIVDEFPVNPNGSMYSIAGLTNSKGNVLALMPHPERCNWMRQVPGHTGTFEELESAGPGRFIFENMKKYIEERT